MNNQGLLQKKTFKEWNKQFTYERFKEAIFNKIQQSVKMTHFPHKLLYNLLKKALVGFCQTTNQNLTSTVKTFYDLDEIAKDRGVNQQPCEGEGGIQCDCIIGELIKQQIFVNIGKQQQNEENYESSATIQNLIEGKISMKGGTEGAFGFGMELQKFQNKNNVKIFKVKTLSYTYGQIILKISVFKKEFLKNEIVKLRNKIIQQRRQESYYKSAIGKQQTQTTPKKKCIEEISIMHEFIDQFGNLLPFKCDVGIYVSKFCQIGKQTLEKNQATKGEVNANNMLNLTAENKCEEDNRQQNINENLIIVMEPNIIKRSDYKSTNQLADIDEPSEETLIRYQLETNTFLLLFQKTGSDKFIINMNDVSEDGTVFKLIPYREKEKRINRLHTIVFRGFRIEKKIECKHVIQCTLVSRSVEKKCKLNIRRQKYLSDELRYFELDQISFQTLEGQFFYLSQQDREKQSVDFWSAYSKEMIMNMKEVEQNNGYFYLLNFETTNDLNMKENYKIRRKKQEIDNKFKKVQQIPTSTQSQKI